MQAVMLPTKKKSNNGTRRDIFHLLNLYRGREEKEKEGCNECTNIKGYRKYVER